VFLVCGIPPLQQHKSNALGFLCRLVAFLRLGFASKRRGKPPSELPEYSILPIFEQKLASFYWVRFGKKIGSDLKSRESREPESRKTKSAPHSRGADSRLIVV
jgi:hypothetical protein